MIVFWDHVISHANKSSDVAFLKEHRRVSVVAARAKLRLIMFTRTGMLEEHFSSTSLAKRPIRILDGRCSRRSSTSPSILRRLSRKNALSRSKSTLPSGRSRSISLGLGAGVARSPDILDDEDDVSQDGDDEKDDDDKKEEDDT
jgi:hypothetical protein